MFLRPGTALSAAHGTFAALDAMQAACSRAACAALLLAAINAACAWESKVCPRIFRKSVLTSLDSRLCARPPGRDDACEQARGMGRTAALCANCVLVGVQGASASRRASNAAAGAPALRWAGTRGGKPGLQA